MRVDGVEEEVAGEGNGPIAALSDAFAPPLRHHGQGARVPRARDEHGLRRQRGRLHRGGRGRRGVLGRRHPREHRHGQPARDRQRGRSRGATLAAAGPSSPWPTPRPEREFGQTAAMDPVSTNVPLPPAELAVLAGVVSREDAQASFDEMGRLAVAGLREFIPEPFAGHRMLDFGCGAGKVPAPPAAGGGAGRGLGLRHRGAADRVAARAPVAAAAGVRQRRRAAAARHPGRLLRPRHGRQRLHPHHGRVGALARRDASRAEARAACSWRPSSATA